MTCRNFMAKEEWLSSTLRKGEQISFDGDILKSYFFRRTIVRVRT